ncbi:peptidoglycan DD-metalloendopeptidase family protein [Methylophilaceae bacterium]|nr:peptidoglycan DD-metalloendopeptidase family protein [Methylophilaceae bacterium]
MNKSTIKIQALVLIAIFFLQLYPNIGLADNTVLNKKDALIKIKKNIEVINKKIKKNTEVKKTLTKQLKKEEKKISGTKKELYQIKKKVKKNSRNLNKLKKRLKSLNKEIKEKKKILSQHFYRTYTQGEPNQIQMILEGSNPNKISRDIEYIRLFTQSQNKNIEKIKKKYKELDKNKKKTNTTLKKVVSLKKNKEKKAKQLIKQKKSKSKILKKINSEITTQKKIKTKLISDEKKLTNLITNLINKSIANAKLKKIEGNTKEYKKNIPPQKFDGINFKKLKKKLKLPVIGKVIYKFGKKRPTTGTRWKGIFIKAKEGNDVFAVATGQIVFSDWLPGYGNIIIINHGKGYMSLYGNNQSLLKQSNEIVKGGEVIAIVGNSGGNKSNGVYYELRKNSKPFNPLSWTK